MIFAFKKHAIAICAMALGLGIFIHASPAMALTTSVLEVNLDNPYIGGPANSFVRYDALFDVAVGENELVMDFGDQNLILTGLDIIRMQLTTIATNVSVQFNDESGALIGPSMSASYISPGLYFTGNLGGLDILANGVHIFFTAPTASVNVDIGIFFGVNSLGSVAITDAETSTVPVPAALPLFGTGLAAMGFLGWRRKRKTA